MAKGRCLEVGQLGTPCTSFSIARKHGDGGPPPVRDLGHLYRLPDLTESDQQLLEVGTLLVQVAIQLALLCRQAGAKWSIENPASSMIWMMPEMLDLQAQCQLAVVKFDMCAFGWQSKKPTTTWVSEQTLSSLCSCCPGRHRHVHLTGKVWSPEHNKFMWRTKLAQVYPDSLCLEWADLISHSDVSPDADRADPDEVPMPVDEVLWLDL